MNDFLKLVQNSGIVQQIRAMVPEHQLEEFDEIVKSMVASGSDTYMSHMSKLTKFQEGVKGVKRGNNSSSEQRRDDDSSNE